MHAPQLLLVCHFLNFNPKHFLVGQNITGPLLHLLHILSVTRRVDFFICTHLILADPDFLGNLSNQTEIVAHENQASLERVDGISQRIDCLFRV